MISERERITLLVLAADATVDKDDDDDDGEGGSSNNNNKNDDDVGRLKEKEKKLDETEAIFPAFNVVNVDSPASQPSSAARRHEVIAYDASAQSVCLQ